MLTALTLAFWNFFFSLLDYQSSENTLKERKSKFQEKNSFKKRAGENHMSSYHHKQTSFYFVNLWALFLPIFLWYNIFNILIANIILLVNFFIYSLNQYTYSWNQERVHFVNLFYWWFNYILIFTSTGRQQKQDGVNGNGSNTWGCNRTGRKGLYGSIS